MKHSILFTGHMLDTDDRPEPRFPVKNELAVRDQIRNHIIKVKEKIKGELTGIAGGACGGDILFHELCAEMNIPSRMYLALPIEEFKSESVSFAGDRWEERFDELTKKLPVYILPGTTGKDKNKNAWERVNSWMLSASLEGGSEHMTLITLWDGKGGDGSGGTEHMIRIANQEHVQVEMIDITRLEGRENKSG